MNENSLKSSIIQQNSTSIELLSLYSTKKNIKCNEPPSINFYQALYAFSQYFPWILACFACNFAPLFIVLFIRLQDYSINEIMSGDFHSKSIGYDKNIVKLVVNSSTSQTMRMAGGFYAGRIFHSMPNWKCCSAGNVFNWMIWIASEIFSTEKAQTYRDYLSAISFIIPVLDGLELLDRDKLLYSIFCSVYRLNNYKSSIISCQLNPSNPLNTNKSFARH